MLINSIKKQTEHWLWPIIDQANGWRIPVETNTLVINGFWRSGTTWLQEIVAQMLKAKPIFEPFQASAGYIFKCLDEIKPKRKDYEFINALMPYTGQGLVHKNTEIYKLLKKSFQGQISHPNVIIARGNRQRLKECLRSKIVTKFTRGALFLEGISNMFNLPILHITRDPRATISSLRKISPTWGEKAFLNFSLYDHLLAVEDGRKEFFSHWKSEIEAIEKTNDFGRLAGYYCLTERYIKEHMANFSAPFIHIRYEDLITNGYPYLQDTISQGDN